MTKRGWIIFVSLIIVAFGAAVYMTKQNKVDVTDVDVNTVQKATADTGNIADHTIGTGSKVTLIEYGDYQCPGCDAVAPIIKPLIEKYKDKLTFVFRNKLISGHQNSRAAASFAEAAGLQGKYFEMHDKLYDTQKAWETLPADQTRTNFFADLITQVGGDAAKAKQDVDTNPSIAKKISFDDALAGKHGVTGTPSFYINGKNVSNMFVLNGAIANKGDKDSAGNDAHLVWSNADDFEKLVIQPALKDAGIQ